VISIVTGTLVTKDLDRVEILTSGGVGYELAVPLGTFEKLPRTGDQVSLHTHLVVREDEWQLYGFATAVERRVFRKLLAATGVGPSLALGMLSTLTAERVVRRNAARGEMLAQQNLGRLEVVLADQSPCFDHVGRWRLFLGFRRWIVVPVEPYRVAQFNGRRFVARSGSHCRSCAVGTFPIFRFASGLRRFDFG
jgi:hypothetical protein